MTWAPMHSRPSDSDGVADNDADTPTVQAQGLPVAVGTIHGPANHPITMSRYGAGLGFLVSPCSGQLGAKHSY